MGIFYLVGSYLKLHIKSIVFLIIGLLGALLIFYLYNLPLEPFFYAFAIVMVIGLAIGILDFIKFRANHKVLKGLSANIVAIEANMPSANSLLEEDYQAIILALIKSRAEEITQRENLLTNITDYYTMWVHQIKTPIFAMQLLLQNSDIDTASLKEQLFKTEQYAQMALQYIRSETMQKDFVFKHYSLDGIIRQALRKYSILFINKKLKLTYDPTNLMVLTDEKWLTFVIEQLISNAIKYTDKGEIRIYLKGQELIIEDSGIGIEQEDLPRIFERGFTGFNGREYKKSTGIGLFLCKKILLALGHTIGVQSEVGIGTKVIVGFLEKQILAD